MVDRKIKHRKSQTYTDKLEVIFITKREHLVVETARAAKNVLLHSTRLVQTLICFTIQLDATVNKYDSDFLEAEKKFSCYNKRKNYEFYGLGNLQLKIKETLVFH